MRTNIIAIRFQERCLNSSNTAGHNNQSADQPQPENCPVLQATELFRGGREVVIRHDGQDYRLRITRQNKMILTK